MNRLETIPILLVTWLAVAFEISFQSLRNSLGAQVSLLPPLLVYVALSTSLSHVALLALVGGLALDAFSLNPLGTSTLTLGMTGLLLHHKRDLVLRHQGYAQLLMGFLASALVPLLAVLLLLNTAHAVPLTGRLVLQWLVLALGGALATPVIFRLFTQLGRWFSYQPLPESHYRETRQIKRTRFTHR